MVSYLGYPDMCPTAHKKLHVSSTSWGHMMRGWSWPPSAKTLDFSPGQSGPRRQEGHGSELPQHPLTVWAGGNFIHLVLVFRGQGPWQTPQGWLPEGVGQSPQNSQETFTRVGGKSLEDGKWISPSPVEQSQVEKMCQIMSQSHQPGTRHHSHQALLECPWAELPWKLSWGRSAWDSQGTCPCVCGGMLQRPQVDTSPWYYGHPMGSYLNAHYMNT